MSPRISEPLRPHCRPESPSCSDHAARSRCPGAQVLESSVVPLCALRHYYSPLYSALLPAFGPDFSRVAVPRPPTTHSPTVFTVSCSCCARRRSCQRLRNRCHADSFETRHTPATQAMDPIHAARGTSPHVRPADRISNRNARSLTLLWQMHPAPRGAAGGSTPDGCPQPQELSPSHCDAATHLDDGACHALKQ